MERKFQINEVVSISVNSINFGKGRIVEYAKNGKNEDCYWVQFYSNDIYQRANRYGISIISRRNNDTEICIWEDYLKKVSIPKPFGIVTFCQTMYK